ncbi:hypothetical protein [Agrobacterium radiobacter]|uniref:hypothetical protein n=1 Tax=Agrobacterium radiobacter TaxID=362 RepID=UPI000DD87B0A
MTSFVHIEPGQWVLAFYEPYGPFNREMSEHLEMFTSQGGGWDHHRETDIFRLHRVTDVKPKTYFADITISKHKIRANDRYHRSHVIAAGSTEEEMTALRAKFFAIGVDADDRVNKEMYRRIKIFKAKERAAALEKIHACLPHIFGRAK